MGYKEPNNSTFKLNKEKKRQNCKPYIIERDVRLPNSIGIAPERSLLSKHLKVEDTPREQLRECIILRDYNHYNWVSIFSFPKDIGSPPLK